MGKNLIFLWYDFYQSGSEICNWDTTADLIFHLGSEVEVKNQ